MRLHRIFYPFTANLRETVLIETDKAHYIRNVLRFKVTQELLVFNDNQQEFLAEITAINKKNVEIKLVKSINPIPLSKLNITLVQSLSKGERMDYTVQKATELGINKIQPIYSEFCEVKLKGVRLDKKIKHWNNIAISACEQSFRTDIPTISLPISIDKFCQCSHKGLLLDPNEKQTVLGISKNKWDDFEVVIGPEGGWSLNDLNLLKSTGLTGIQFGQRILRTETMAPAILASIHSLWGDFT